MSSYLRPPLSGETRGTGSENCRGNENGKEDVEMSALIANWFFIVVMLVCCGMHLFGHRHHGHDHGPADDGKHA